MIKNFRAVTLSSLLLLSSSLFSENFSSISESIISDQLLSMNAKGLTTGPNQILVAVIDTGLNLKSKILTPNYVYGNFDYNHNGRMGFGFDFSDNDLFPNDEGGHGTHVAGIIKSVSPNVKILPMRVFDKDGKTDRFKIIKAVRYAMNLGARVINLSLGGIEPSELNKAFWNELMGNATFGSSVSIVVAAGNSQLDNDKIDVFPANVKSPNLISVCSVDKNHNFSQSFSNFGKNNVDICALGENVYSLSHTSDSLVSMSGTSMAAPYVAGALALILSYYPNLSPNQLKAIVKNSASKNISVFNRCSSQGILDIYSALRDAAAYPLN